MVSAAASVLLLDPDPAHGRHLIEAFAGEGWPVVQVAPNDLLEPGYFEAKGIPATIVIADAGAGAEWVARLRAETLTRTTPILFLSNHESEGLDADAYLPLEVSRRVVVATVRTLLRMRRAEESDFANSAKYQAVIANMIEGVVTMDREGNFLAMNPAAMRIYGFDEGTEIPRSVAEQEKIFLRQSLDGQTLSAAELPHARAVRGEFVNNFEMRVTRRDTGRSWVGSYNATLARTPDGVVDVVIMTMHDVTDRKTAEDELRRAQAALQSHAEQLEQKVADRTSSLREAVSQMEEFSYTVSHDLRAPLRSIKGYAEILLLDYGPRLKGEGQKYLERIIESGNRMERLVNDVLTISRISSAKLQLEPVALEAILNAIIAEYPNLQPKAARIRIESLPSVVGHPSLCTQIFSNLLSNAAKFVRPGSFPEIRVWAEIRGPKARICVRDNGIGISPEFHEKIFGMFERLEADPRYAGTGIGLAIVRRAVDKMGGRVGVESDGSQGSVFWVELTLAN